MNFGLNRKMKIQVKKGNNEKRQKMKNEKKENEKKEKKIQTKRKMKKKRKIEEILLMLTYHTLTYKLGT